MRGVTVASRTSPALSRSFGIDTTDRSVQPSVIQIDVQRSVIVDGPTDDTRTSNERKGGGSLAGSESRDPVDIDVGAEKTDEDGVGADMV